MYVDFPLASIRFQLHQVHHPNAPTLLAVSAVTNHTALEFHTVWLMDPILQFFIPVLKTWMVKETSSDILDASKWIHYASVRFRTHEIQNFLLCLIPLFWLSSHIIHSKHHAIYILRSKTHPKAWNQHLLLWRPESGTKGKKNLWLTAKVWVSQHNLTANQPHFCKSALLLTFLLLFKSSLLKGVKGGHSISKILISWNSSK